MRFLIELRKKGHLLYDEVYKSDGTFPDLGEEAHENYLAQLRCLMIGLSDYTRTGEKPMKVYLTELGNKFVDFIADESLKRI